MSVDNQSVQDLLNTLVGDGKKFKTVEELAAGKVEADRFIEDLKTENKALREILTKDDGGKDDVANKLNQILSKVGSGTTTKPDVGNQSKTESLSKQEVLELLETRDRAQREQRVKAEFDAKVTKAFGDKAEEIIVKRLREQAIDKDLFDAMVVRSPHVALGLLGLKEDPAQGGTGERGSSVNTEAFLANQNNSNGVKNWQYFQRLRKELGPKYYSETVQQDVLKARKDLGDAFWK